MNEICEEEALSELIRIKAAYQRFIRDNFETSAQNCQTCPTFGVCCTDAQFVNVHITPLEAVAIKNALEQKLTEKEKQKLFSKIAETIEKYDLNQKGDTFEQTFACPLFTTQNGCLVHESGTKPTACIQHACYQQQEDLPPQCLQDYTEKRIEKLNYEAYGHDWRWLPLPLQLAAIISGHEK